MLGQIQSLMNEVTGVHSSLCGWLGICNTLRGVKSLGFPEFGWEWGGWGMDDRLRERVQGFVEELLREEKSSIRKARTLLEIENQAIEIGDELVRQLANSDLAVRQYKSGLMNVLRATTERDLHSSALS